MFSPRLRGVVCPCALLLVALTGCGKVANPNGSPDGSTGGDGDAGMDDAGVADGPGIDTPPPGALGAMDNPAKSCGELRAAGGASGVFWLQAPSSSTPFRAYCDQLLNGGGWAMLENSVRRADGTTTAFWQFTYPDRLKQKGTPAPDQNYYDGSLYLLGTEYIDIIVDLKNKTAVVAQVTVSGFDQATMKFLTPTPGVNTQTNVFAAHFQAGWSAQDYNGGPATANCATLYSKVAQHYSSCWAYNLGSDADGGTSGTPAAIAANLDGGVGPHVNNDVLTDPGVALSIQDSGGKYSQVNRIARFTRW